MVGALESDQSFAMAEKFDILSDGFDPTAVAPEPLPLPVTNGTGADQEEENLKKTKVVNGGGEREMVLGRNVHTTSLAVTEPESNDEFTGDKEAYMASVLARYRKTLVERTKYHLGYPYNLDFDYGALGQLQHFSINNLGDPFIESNYGVHSRPFEVGVLDWFARLWEIERDDYWGYITNCGTEGNLHGILVGREVFPDGILYASSESHYSVFKAARMYRMECQKVDTLISGEIDCDDFRRKLSANKDKPAILNVNIGTTVKGAVDDLDLVIKTLEECGFSHDRFYIHCDGALFGLMMPFVKRAPKVTFNKPIGSVSVSGHKFVGCPMPCGVQITRMKHIKVLSNNVEYLASRDATIMGSRNGHAPLFLWYTLNRKGYKGFQKEVQKCLRNAHYLKDRLREAGISAMLNELSSTVVFERPKEEEEEKTKRRERLTEKKKAFRSGQMAPKKSDGEGKAKPTTVTTPVRQTRSMDRKTRSQTRRDSPGGGSSSSKLFTFESPEKKKRKPKAKDAGPATKKIKQEKEEAADEEGKKPEEDDDDVAAAKEEGDDGAEHKRIVIEHCKQCKSFKERANELKDGLEIAVPGIIVTVNADKPRRGCFEIREEGGQTFVSLLDMKRPFKEMKDLDMEQVIADIVEKLK